MTHSVSHPKYRPDIDGLRAVAVLAVVVFHAFPNSLKGGFAGVDVFFVISGFLISTILFQNIDRKTFSIADFYSRRIRRIFPALSLVLAIVLVFGWFCLLPDELQQLGKHTAASAGFIQNFILWGESGYFDNASDTKPLLHIWSLGIEEQFYFIWPLLLSIGGNFRESRHKKIFYLIIMSLVFLVSFLLNINLVKVDPTKTFYLPQYRFWELALGGLLAWVVLYKPRVSSVHLNTNYKYFLKPHVIKKACDATSILGFFILIAVFIKFDKQTIFPGFNALWPVFGTAMIIFAGQDSFLNRKFLANKIMVWFGLISFPLYLWHWPILSFGRIIYGDEPTQEFRLSAVVAASILSWLTVKFIEKPFRFGTSAKNKKIIFLAFSAAVIGGLGFATWKVEHLPERERLKSLRVNGSEDVIGLSVRGFQGKSGWLFLGNEIDKTISKLKLSLIPKESEIQSMERVFSVIANDCAHHGIDLVLFVGPDKTSIYPEFLPDGLRPSRKKYIDFFLERLRDIPHLKVYDPTAHLLAAKDSPGYIYFKTDTHWNNKGAFIAFQGFSSLLNIPVPEVQFRQGPAFSGDLVGLSGVKDIQLSADDNWEVVWPKKVLLTERQIPGEQETVFGPTKVVSNQNPLVKKIVWVIGDSFTTALRQYFDATFEEVRYVGHLDHKLRILSAEIANADKKPDLIVVIKVERTF